MPATIIEQHGSRSFQIGVNSGSGTWLFFVHGEDDELAVENLIRDTSPATWYALTRDDIDAKRRNALDQWDVTVNYKYLPFPVETGSLPAAGLPSGDPIGNPAPSPSPSADPPADNAIVNGTTFSISMENEHVERSEKTITSAMLIGPNTAGEWNERYGGLIGVVPDGNGGVKVMGCERGFPVANIRRKATIEGMTWRYFKTLMLMAGRSNSGPWWIFGTEDAMLVGVDGQQLDTAGRFSLEFEFLYRRPKIDHVWGSVPGNTGELDLVATKRGQQFVWFSYKERMVSGRPQMRVHEVFVERICEVDDFNWLGI